MKKIATIYTDFPEKFGLPRQSNLIEELTGRIEFEPECNSCDAVRGLEDFEYIWLIWEFDDSTRKHLSLTVRPPRLGGNTRMGVFATRSPFRPNPIGLSSVKLNKIEYSEHGPVLYVSGIDMRDGTPIFDIKPYLPLSDAHADAKAGFADAVAKNDVDVIFSEELQSKYNENFLNEVFKILRHNPRPSYHDEPNRIYGLSYKNKNIKFMTNEGVINVIDIK